MSERLDTITLLGYLYPLSYLTTFELLKHYSKPLLICSAVFATFMTVLFFNKRYIMFGLINIIIPLILTFIDISVPTKVFIILLYSLIATHIVFGEKKIIYLNDIYELHSEAKVEPKKD